MSQSASNQNQLGQNALRHLCNRSVASLVNSEQSGQSGSVAKSVASRGCPQAGSGGGNMSVGNARHSLHREGWTHVPTDPSTLGRTPCQRSLHAAAVLRDSMYIFGGYDGLNRVNDFYEYHFPSKKWREIISVSPLSEGSGNGGAEAIDLGRAGGRHERPPTGTLTATGQVPSPRDRHAAVVHRSSFYIFGGFDGTSRVSDLHGFDVDKLVWTEVWPRGNHVNINNSRTESVGNRAAGIAGPDLVGQPHLLEPNRALFAEGETVQVPQHIHQPPSPRHSHAAVVYQNCLYVFGGYDGSYRSDFHEFNFETLTWQPVLASGRSPRARYRSTACVLGEKMILFGGHDGTRHLADVHLFDFVDQVWSLLVPIGIPPLPRDSHVSVAYKDSMYVFGGSTGSAMNDLYELSFRTNIQDKNEAQSPAEDGHSCTQNGPEDGVGPSAVVRDALPTSAKWRQIPVLSGGVAVHRFCHVGAVHQGSLYVFGGYDGSSRLNDFVKYDLAADNLFETDIPPPTLLADLRSFLDDEEVMSFADITLMVEGTPVRAHKLMLMRCPYFRAMLLGDMAESSQTVVNIEIVKHSIFSAVLEYLYTDNVSIPLDSAMELFVAADCFHIPRLQAMCERKLLEFMTVENAATIFLTADVHSAVSLRDKALGFILLHFEEVSKTPSFEEMVRSNVDLVFEILKSR
mmetsp:Transcript_8966/g.15580  ORF Transcript_8966/g.15580 Transcript_8966/m.15580 type:complete len:685 (-) Transcript_8966:243-2297(-)